MTARGSQTGPRGGRPKNAPGFLSREDLAGLVQRAGSQRKLAKLAGVSAGNLATYLSGRRTCPTWFASKLLRGLRDPREVPGRSVELPVAGEKVRASLSFDLRVRVAVEDLGELLRVPVDLLRRAGARFGAEDLRPLGFALALVGEGRARLEGLRAALAREDAIRKSSPFLAFMAFAALEMKPETRTRTKARARRKTWEEKHSAAVKAGIAARRKR